MADRYEAHYIYEQTRYVEGVLHLDDDTLRAYRDAVTDDERHHVIDPLVVANVQSSEGTGNLGRDIKFQVFKNEAQS